LTGANDYVAMGAMSVLFRRGRMVPRDVSVAGFGGEKNGPWLTATSC
jgi:DNA-binding LacI/PurR family transcriptional regulator